jgi:hypothetical protein
VDPEVALPAGQQVLAAALSHSGEMSSGMFDLVIVGHQKRAARKGGRIRLAPAGTCGGRCQEEP